MRIKRKLIFLHSIVLFLILAVALGYASRAFSAPRPLPFVSPNMENPEFWIRKIENPNRLLLAPEAIQKMNDRNTAGDDLWLSKVIDLKEEWTKEEIQSLLKEDWEGFGRTEEIRYGRYGHPLQEAFWRKLKDNLNQESLKERNRILIGLIVNRTDIRVFPTEEFSMSTPANDEFDRFQHSSITPGSPIGLYHFSRDGLWAYAQTPFIRGWIRVIDLAVALEKKEVVEYDRATDRLVITGNFVHLFANPSLQQTVFSAPMGTSFPILERTGKNCGVKIPFRESDGHLTFRRAYLPWEADVHSGFLPYTQKNLAYQAFKMLHHPYGWGEMSGGRDCSRFIMDLFASFGMLMPRNSKFQARVGISLGQVEGKTSKEKEKILDRAMPLATILRLPGHIMLYLGKEGGRYYAIHSIWGIQKRGWFGSSLEKIGKTVVSDLSLGKSGPNGSLLHRLTDIQFIGSEMELPK
jgi:hypothetical protein